MKVNDARKEIDSNECEVTNDAGEITLENAIVIQACKDYRAALRGECEYPKRMLADVMRFFQSGWYQILTNADWHYLVERMDKEYESGQRLIAAGLKVDCPELRKSYKFKCPLCGGEAETHSLRYAGKKRKDGTRKVIYRRVFNCSCHIPERITIREETEVAENA